LKPSIHASSSTGAARQPVDGSFGCVTSPSNHEHEGHHPGEAGRVYERRGVYQLPPTPDGERSRRVEFLGTTDRGAANRTGTARRALGSPSSMSDGPRRGRRLPRGGCRGDGVGRWEGLAEGLIQQPLVVRQ
jgi:hypothetical protein